MLSHHKLTFQPAVKVGVGGHEQTWVRHEETADVLKTGTDVTANLLQFCMLLVGHLQHGFSVRQLMTALILCRYSYPHRQLKQNSAIISKCVNSS